MTDETALPNRGHDARVIIDAYYETLQGGERAFDPARMRNILAVDLDFEGPLAGRMSGAEPFIQGVLGFVETVQGLTMLHLLVECHDGCARAAAMYDARMPAATVRFAEFFTVEHRTISTLRLLYDARAYVAAGGR